jgi:hypothetical protein
LAALADETLRAHLPEPGAGSSDDRGLTPDVATVKGIRTAR